MSADIIISFFGGDSLYLPLLSPSGGTPLLSLSTTRYIWVISTVNVRHALKSKAWLMRPISNYSLCGSHCQCLLIIHIACVIFLTMWGPHRGFVFTMSRRISIFSFRRLFSSSSCTFFFLRRCSSLPDTFPPDSRFNRWGKINISWAWDVLTGVLWICVTSVSTCVPMSTFKFPCLTFNVQHRRPKFKAQLHFSCWAIQLPQQCKNRQIGGWSRFTGHAPDCRIAHYKQCSC